MDTIRIGLFGTAHSHAPGKLRAVLAHPGVEFAGVWEADARLRERARTNAAYEGLAFVSAAEELLEDPTVHALCVEGDEGKCSQDALRAVTAGKHIWYDKPAGDWPVFQAIIETARERRLHVQLGYMLRYSAAFGQVAEWVRTGFLGDVFKVRGNMSALRDEASRRRADYPGGVGFELAPHLMDQALWLFGRRPEKVTSFLRNDATPDFPGYADNTLVVLEFARGMALLEVAANEVSPQARRFEVYGTRGSATVLEPFEPGARIKLVLDEARGGYAKGEQDVEVSPTPRSVSFPAELESFVATIRGASPHRPLEHELLVEETLHRAVGNLPARAA
jgi:predicted dehydrogenase